VLRRSAGKDKKGDLNAKCPKCNHCFKELKGGSLHVEVRINPSFNQILFCRTFIQEMLAHEILPSYVRSRVS